MFWKRNKEVALKKVANRLVNENTAFNIQESYKQIRTNLMFTLAQKKVYVVAVTSTFPKEGKSTTSSNLAITLAQTNRKVLLIDADMRKPVLGELFEIETKEGLSQVLGGFCTYKDTIVETKYDNLYLMPAGHIPPNPTELLASSNMCNLLEILKQEYDYIIIDTPPINLVTDALIFSEWIGGYIYVVKYKSTTHKGVKEGLEKIKKVNGELLGFIVGEVPSKARHYKRYRQYAEHCINKETTKEQSKKEKDVKEQSEKVKRAPNKGAQI